jgi:hypothetical protein
VCECADTCIHRENDRDIETQNKDTETQRHTQSVTEAQKIRC